MHSKDEPVREGAPSSAAMFGAPPIEPVPPPDRFLDSDCEAGNTLQVGDTISFLPIFTPGHCPGHVVFWDKAHGNAFVGDLIFQGSVGRTDLPLANPGHMRDSLRLMLDTLPDSCKMLPGHMGPTTMGQERTSNHFLAHLQ